MLLTIFIGLAVLMFALLITNVMFKYCILPEVNEPAYVHEIADIEWYIRCIEEQDKVIAEMQAIIDFNNEYNANEYYRQQAEEHYQNISHNPDYDIDL